MHSPYQPSEYWTERLRNSFSLDGVGYLGLGPGLNYWIYLRRRQAVRRLFRRAGLSIKGARIAELGVGTGYWVAEWKARGAATVLGIDITEPSVHAMRAKFPEYRFEQSNLGEPGALRAAAGDEDFDLIVAMEVLLHIVEPGEFRAALDNISSIARAGTYLLLSDLFLSVEVKNNHQHSRTLHMYRTELAARHFELLRRDPVFFTLHPAHFTKTGIGHRLESLRWANLVRLMRVLPSLGWAIGAPLFVADRIMEGLSQEGPSTHLTLWRRV